MKRLLAVSLLALSLSTSVLAGDIPFPGKEPPPCTQNCSEPTTSPEPIPAFIIGVALTLITLRP